MRACKKSSIEARETGEEGKKCIISFNLPYSIHIFVEVKKRFMPDETF